MTTAPRTDLVPVEVLLPLTTVQALTEVAAGRGMTASQWLATQARHVTLGVEQRDTVVRLHAHGFTDAEIARRLNMTNSQVATRRRRYGLAANRAARL